MFLDFMDEKNYDIVVLHLHPLHFVILLPLDYLKMISFGTGAVHFWQWCQKSDFRTTIPSKIQL